MEELLRKAKRVLVLEQVTATVCTNNGTTVMKCKETQTPFYIGQFCIVGLVRF